MSVPFLSRADEWDQVPSSGNGGGEMTAPPEGDDGQTVADFLAQIGGSRGGGHGACEIVGMFADIAAVSRDQGATEQHQLTQIDNNFDQQADQRHVPREWIRPIRDVVHREVAYVYDHPGMPADQVKSQWTYLCESQQGNPQSQ
jgi:hypothetical protein